MSDEQETRFINCSNCGKIVEAVSPVIGGKVSKVLLSIKYVDGNAIWPDEHTEFNCPFCKEAVRVYWYYN